jgi:YbgC/YbaW family acyl-CoA thioester hydrolase
MPFEFNMTRRVEFADTDMAGIMHFSNFFRMMEATEHAFFRSLGSSIHTEINGDSIGWPRVSAHCDYQRPLRFEEEVSVHLLVTELRTRSLRYLFIFRKTADGSEVARGQITAVCARINHATGQLTAIPIPEVIRSQLSAAPAELTLSPHRHS